MDRDREMGLLSKLFKLLDRALPDSHISVLPLDIYEFLCFFFLSQPDIAFEILNRGGGALDE